MQKLYRRINGVLHYHEAWVAGREITEHWGVAGDMGETTTHKLPKRSDGDAAVTATLKGAAAKGYVPVDEIGETTLLIEYQIDGFGTPKDLAKRHALEDRMNDTLGWTGLGHCDGGSTGSGTMEVWCYVADFTIAKRVIEADLARTEFGDFTRIYQQEDAEPRTAADGET
jgi:hypothetical protein